jgi:hypothetical protein
MSVANGPSTVATLFADSILVVPPYQRAYAWDPEPHLRNFIEDLSSQPPEANRKYFFGTILLAASRQFKGHLLSGYAIVDGQQRLTTSCIFAAVALSQLRSDVDLAKFAEGYFQRFIKDGLGTRKFHTITEDDGFFERFIIGDQTGSDALCDTPSQRRLLNAKRFFEEKLKGITAVEANKLLTVLCESQILLWLVDSDLQATQIFELQNDRGKRLTDLEALKSFLMHGIYLHTGNNAESDLNILQRNFAAIYRAAERMEEGARTPVSGWALPVPGIPAFRNLSGRRTRLWPRENRGWVARGRAHSGPGREARAVEEAKAIRVAEHGARQLAERLHHMRDKG